MLSLVEEEDVFESDFASTEEEEEDDEAGEKALEEEERRARRVCPSLAFFVPPTYLSQAARSKGFKIPTAPQLKVKFDISVTKDEESPLTPGGTKSKQSRRVSLGPAVDAETGEVVESSKRQSTREATRLNTQDLRTRLKDAESRKVANASEYGNDHLCLTLGVRHHSKTSKRKETTSNPSGSHHFSFRLGRREYEISQRISCCRGRTEKEGSGG